MNKDYTVKVSFKDKGYAVARVQARDGFTALMLALQSSKFEGEIIGAKVVYITFTEWYKDIHNQDWHEDYAGLYSFANDMADGYLKWCEENKQIPIWNG